MAEMTLDQIWRAASQLPPDEQKELIKRLQTERRRTTDSILDDIPVLPGGERFRDMSLRREDLYGDDER